VARPIKRPGSSPGRGSSQPRDFDAGLHAILRDYWGFDEEPAVYGEEDSERRVRVPRVVFETTYNDIKDRPFRALAIHATGRPQAHPLQKLVGAFRVLAYGESDDRADEYVRLSHTSIAVATSKQVDFIVEEYEKRYLRPPNDEELKCIVDLNAERGMPGRMGSIERSEPGWVRLHSPSSSGPPSADSGDLTGKPLDLNRPLPPSEQSTS